MAHVKHMSGQASLGETDFQELVARYRRRNGKHAGSETMQRVHRYVLDKIRTGTFAPGAKVVELQVARELGLSCVPVREAMAKLEQEGWVVRVPNRGVFVKALSATDIKELFFVRHMIETTAVEQIAATITDEQLEELEQVSAVIVAARKARDLDLVEEADPHFHRLLVHFTGNRRLESMFETVLTQATGTFFRLADNFPGLDVYIYPHLERVDHDKICAALREHDAVKARALVEEHWRVGYESVEAVMRLNRRLASPRPEAEQDRG